MDLDVVLLSSERPGLFVEVRRSGDPGVDTPTNAKRSVGTRVRVHSQIISINWFFFFFFVCFVFCGWVFIVFFLKFSFKS